MTRKVSFAILLLSGYFFLIQIEAFKQPTCRGKETKLTDEELKMMTDCIKEVKGNDAKSFADVPKESMGCVGKCVLQRQGLVDTNGKPVKDNVFKLVNATFEPDIAKMADEKLGKCIDEKSTGIDANEKSCKTYWPLVECVAAAFMEICSTNSTSSDAES